MDIILIEQVKNFGIFLISGMIIGILYDIFRIIRKSFKISDIHTYIEDVFFGILLGIFLIYLLFINYQGKIRLYMIFSLLIGIIVYEKVISKFFIKINVKILQTFKLVIKKTIQILLFPLHYTLKIFIKILNKPYMLMIINLKKWKNAIDYQKYQKKLHKRKDFTK